MNKDKIKEKFLKKYLKGDSVTEHDLLFQNEKFFKQIISAFSSWAKFEKEIGFLQRHIRERDKFYYYWLLKFRLERFGPESLRHKNIEENFKDKLQEEFGTVKYLTDTLIQKQEKEALFYEVHAFLLTGGSPYEIKTKRPDLYKKIIKEHSTKELFFEKYAKMFVLNPLELDYEIIEEVSNEEFTLDLATLIKMGYLDKEDAEKLKEETNATTSNQA